MTQVNINGQSSRRPTKVSVYDHGLLYGDGVFEGIRVTGKVFRCTEHHRTALRERQAHLPRSALVARGKMIEDVQRHV